MRAGIIKPLISEKTMSLVKNNLYTFVVDRGINKGQIGKIVKNKFSVDVLSVKIINIPAKIKMQRTKRGYFKVAPFKKAIVQVKKGQKIPLFEVPKDEEVKVTTAEGEQLTTIKEKKSLLRGTKVTIESGRKSQETSKKSGKQTKKGNKEE